MTGTLKVVSFQNLLQLLANERFPGAWCADDEYKSGWSNHSRHTLDDLLLTQFSPSAPHPIQSPHNQEPLRSTTEPLNAPLVLEVWLLTRRLVRAATDRNKKRFERLDS